MQSHFASAMSMQQNRSACTVLPDSFLQVIRPFISSNDDFDRSFEETFVIPEFRAMESKSQEARTKMLSYLMAERKAENYATITAIAVGVILVGLFEFTINYLLKLSHPHSTGLQLAFDALLILIVVGVFHPKWRYWCWGGGAFAILCLIIQLLG